MVGQKETLIEMSGADGGEGGKGQIVGSYMRI